MARACVAVGKYDQLPDFDDGVEIVAVSNGLRHLPEQRVTQEVSHSLCVLINLSHDEADRRVIRDVGFKVRDANIDHALFSGEDWESRLRTWLREYPAGVVDVVLLLPDVAYLDELALNTARRALEDVCERTGHADRAVVAICEKPHLWKSLSKVCGFVRSSSSGKAFDANAVLATMVTLMSPVMLTCSDMADMFDCLGDWIRPSVVVVASWNIQERRLDFYTARDRAAVCASDSLAVSCMSEVSTWRDAHELMRQVRALLRPSAGCVYNVSSGFFSASRSLAGDRDAPVVFVMKPTVTNYSELVSPAGLLRTL